MKGSLHPIPAPSYLSLASTKQDPTNRPELRETLLATGSSQEEGQQHLGLPRKRVESTKQRGERFWLHHIEGSGDGLGTKLPVPGINGK